MSEQQELPLGVSRDPARMSPRERKLRVEVVRFEKFTPPSFMPKLARALKAEVRLHKRETLTEATVKHVVRMHFGLLLNSNVCARLTRKLRMQDMQLNRLLCCRRSWMDDLPDLP